MRRISAQGLALVMAHEGFVARPYRCPAGYLTIGYGHVIRAGEQFDQGIDKLWARQLLQVDVAEAENAVSRLVAVPLSQGQWDALVSFTFNVGAGALQRSTLRRCVNDERHEEVPAQLMRWVWAGGRKLPGLVARRADEAALYGRSGV